MFVQIILTAKVSSLKRATLRSKDMMAQHWNVINAELICSLKQVGMANTLVAATIIAVLQEDCKEMEILIQYLWIQLH